MNQKNIFLPFATLMMLLFTAYNTEAQTSGTSIKVISPKAAYDLAQVGVLFVDVREKDEVADVSFIIPKIINIPLSEMPERFNEIPKDQQVILVCKSGYRSGQAYEILANKNFNNIANMEGGMNLWIEGGFQVDNNKTVKSACCANPNSKDCNPDGTCKPKSGKKSTKTSCTPNSSDDKKACCEKN